MSNQTLKIVDYKVIADRLLEIAHSAVLDNKTEVEIADMLYQLRTDVIHTLYVPEVVRKHYLQEKTN